MIPPRPQRVIKRWSAKDLYVVAQQSFDMTDDIFFTLDDADYEAADRNYRDGTTAWRALTLSQALYPQN